MEVNTAFFNEEDIIFSYTIEDGLQDGTFIDITEKVKFAIKWQAVMSNSLYEKIKRINKEDEKKITLIIQDVAHMFAINVKRKKSEDINFFFKCCLEAELTIEAEKIVSAINFNKIGEPVLTFCLPEDL